MWRISVISPVSYSKVSYSVRYAGTLPDSHSAAQVTGNNRDQQGGRDFPSFDPFTTVHASPSPHETAT